MAEWVARIDAEYERVRDMRHAQGNHRAALRSGSGQLPVDDLTLAGARRVLDGPELVGVLAEIVDRPNRVTVTLTRKTPLLLVIGQANRQQGPVW